MSSTFVLMGSFTVKKKHTSTPQDYIVSPSAQTCIVVVLESSHGVAVAHIDSPLTAAETTATMIAELKKMGKDPITARLYGGYYGPTLMHSGPISNPIYKQLKKNNIQYSHKDYHTVTSGLLTTLATIVWAATPLGPNSSIIALLCIGLAYTASDLVKAILPKKWRPGFLSDNIDVSVNISTGMVKLEKDNEQNNKVVIRTVKATSPTQWNHYKNRITLDPQDKRIQSALTMMRV